MANNWQPIETAPKDGTVIDLWVNGRRRACCYWDAFDYDEPDDECDGWRQSYAECVPGLGGFELGENEKPTHWMPLPNPPLERD